MRSEFDRWELIVDLDDDGATLTIGGSVTADGRHCDVVRSVVTAAQHGMFLQGYTSDLTFTRREVVS